MDDKERNPFVEDVDVKAERDRVMSGEAVSCRCFRCEVCDVWS